MVFSPMTVFLSVSRMSSVSEPFPMGCQRMLLSSFRRIANQTLTSIKRDVALDIAIAPRQNPGTEREKVAVLMVFRDCL